MIHHSERWLQSEKFELNSGDTAWILASTVLVLFMTMPGLAIFYAGMVSTKNVLTVCMQSVSISCQITILWMAFGYSLAFGPSGLMLQFFFYLLHCY
jgi:Amt family ammonium transporter